MEKVWTKNDNECQIPEVFFHFKLLRFLYSYNLPKIPLSRLKASLLWMMCPILLKYLCRSYYRCTHKHDQGCPAIKQVQRIQEDPPLYRTTYYGHHNCKGSFNPEIVLEPASSSGSSILLSFNNNLPSKEEHPFPSSLFASTKQETMEVIPDDNIAHNQLSSSDYLLLCDYELDFNYSKHVTMLSSTDSVEFGNVYGRFGFWWLGMFLSTKFISEGKALVASS